MLILRAFLLAGLLIHKAVWEILKARGTKRSPAPSSLAVRLIKGIKIAILLGLIAQTVIPVEILPILKDPTVLRSLGIVIYSAGLLLAILARVQLGRNWSDIETPQIGSRQAVVSRGVYTLIRHPVYAGDLMLVLGLELALNSWMVLGAILLIPVVARQAIREEKLLAGRLPGYDVYMRRTKRFIPYVV